MRFSDFLFPLREEFCYHYQFPILKGNGEDLFVDALEGERKKSFSLKRYPKRPWSLQIILLYTPPPRVAA
jgi:hypothetical protein